MSVLVAEARKVPAFMRRDLLVMLSYRAAFAGDLFYIAVQAIMFGFVAELIDDSKLPSYGGVPASYFDFVMIGVIITTVCTVLLQRVATAVRQEQMIGTLEALLVTPTSATTVQVGSVAFDLVFIPIRMALLLAAVAITLGLGYELSGVLPSLVLLAGLVPFVWGLGLVTAAAIVTFRRGTGPLGVIMSVLGLASGAFFPLTLLPDWIQTLAEANPVAIAMEGTREALIGGAGWDALGGSDLVVLVVMSGAALFAGVLAFRAALAREHRRGTLGLY
jgi:ABC-2 type transport system permease protein